MTPEAQNIVNQLMNMIEAGKTTPELDHYVGLPHNMHKNDSAKAGYTIRRYRVAPVFRLLLKACLIGEQNRERMQYRCVFVRLAITCSR